MLHLFYFNKNSSVKPLSSSRSCLNMSFLPSQSVCISDQSSNLCARIWILAANAYTSCSSILLSNFKMTHLHQKYFWKSFGEFKILHALWKNLPMWSFDSKLEAFNEGWLSTSTWNIAETDHDKVKWVFTNNGLRLSPCPDMFLCPHPLSSFPLRLWAPGRSPAQLPGTSIQCYSPPKLSPPFPVPHSLCDTCQETPCLLEFRKYQWIIKQPFHLSTAKWHFYVLIRVWWM